jgi:AcrR family transcriptional regulator
MDVAELGLRELKKKETRQLLRETAVQLFSERGFEQVPVSEIARVAQVSAATVFNYFPTKEDLVYSAFEEFQERMLAAVRERPAGESALEAFSRFILEPRGFFAISDEKTARRMMKVARLIADSPALLAREQQIHARYIDSLAELLASETKARANDLRPRVAANAMLGVHRFLIAYVRERLAEDGLVDRQKLWRDVRRRGELAISLLGDGLADYAPKR